MKKTKEQKKRIFPILIFLVLILSDISSVYSLEAGDVVSGEVNIDEKDSHFEDIAVFINSYQPTIVKSWMLEKTDYPVYISLSGVALNPTVDISKIRSVSVTTNGPNRYVAGIYPVAPVNRRYTLLDLGGAVIRLRKEPREARVPDRIDVNLTAIFNLDVSTGFGAVSTDLFLKEQNEQEWFSAFDGKDKSAFWGGAGYVRLAKISDDRADFVVYDDIYRDVTREVFEKDDISLRSRKRTVSLSVGETSPPIPLTRDILARRETGFDQRLSFRDRIKIRLNSIKDAGKYAEVLVTVNGVPNKKTLFERSPIYDGSSWYVDSISEEADSKIVKISNGKDTKIISIKKEVQALGTTAQAAQTEAPGDKEFKSAIDDFDTIVTSYPGSKDSVGNLVSAQATLELAETYYLLKKYDDAVYYYKKYLDDYVGDTQVEADRLAVQELISLLTGKVGYDYSAASSEMVEEDGSYVNIKLLDVTVKTDFSKAYFNIIDKETSKTDIGILSAGQKFTLENGAITSSWFVDEIGAESVKISRLDSNGNKEPARTIRLNAETTIDFADKPRVIKLTKVDYSSLKQAYITVLPAEERLVSRSDFTAHFFIEKRLFDLTPQQIESHIKTTKNLISKFDSAINSLESLHKGWTGWCYGVMATLWIKNLITSFGGRTLARKLVMEKWKDICSREVQKDERGETSAYSREGKLAGNAIYDECLKENVGAIQDEIKKANDAISRADEQASQVLSTSGSKFEGLNKEKDLGLIKDSLVKENLASDLKTEKYINNYISSEVLLEKQKIYTKYDSIQTPEQKKEFLEKNQKDYLEQYNKANTQTQRDEIFRRALQNQIDYELSLKKVELSKRDYKSELGFSDEQSLGLLEDAVESELKTLVLSAEQIKAKTGEKTSVFVGDIRQVDLDGDGKVEDVYLPLGKVVYKDEKGEFYLEAEGTKKVYIEKTQALDLPSKKVQPFYMINVYTSGRHEGLLYRISIDAYDYAEINRADGGQIESIGIFTRVEPNSAMGASTDKPKELFQPASDIAKNPKYSGVYSDIIRINNELASGKKKYDSGDFIVSGATKYVVSNEAAKRTGASCSDFMDPNDCLFLYGACDPIMCPTSRFNRGGNYYVKNVVQTGIFGSIFLGADTLWDPSHGEILPVCLTGIVAGAKNYRSILQGYVRCLETKRDQGRSVGVCDKIRNVGICSVVWREAVAILNVDGGALGILSNKVFDKSSGGGEYAFFKEGIKNSLESAKYFTNQYAQNVFAAYRGDTVGEIGGELCNAAIYGRIPGGGSIIERLSRPTGPPQIYAQIDEVPSSVIPTGDVVKARDYASDYQVYYHIYAGDQSDYIRYFVKVKGPGLPDRTITSVRLLKAGDFVDENVPFVSYSGYSEVCVNVNGENYCGFGMVTTDYGINKLKEGYIEDQAKKTTIDSQKECVPEVGLISSASGPVPRALGVFSSGITQTGIVRKCSSENPGASTNRQDRWIDVGNCGNDELGRDLGTCWLDSDSVTPLVKDKETQDELKKFLEERAKAQGVTLLQKEEMIDLFKKADELSQKAQAAQKASKKSEANALYLQEIEVYTEIINRGALDIDSVAQAHLRRGQAYKNIGMLLMQPEKAKEKKKVIEERKVCKKESDTVWVCTDAASQNKYALEGLGEIEIIPHDLDIKLNYKNEVETLSAKFDVLQNGIKVDCDKIGFEDALEKVYLGNLPLVNHKASISISGDKQEVERFHSCNNKDIKLSVSILFDRTVGMNYNKNLGLISFKVDYITPLIPTTRGIKVLSFDTIKEIKNRKHGSQTYSQIVEQAISEAFYANDVARISSEEEQGFRSIVTPNYIFGIMWTESSGRPGAVSLTGCKGLMGVCEPTARDVGIDPSKREDAKQSIIGGVRTLKQKYSIFDDIKDPQERIKFAILSYNLGEDVVRMIITQTGKTEPSFDEALSYLDPEDIGRSEGYKYLIMKYGESYKSDKVRESLPYVKKVLAYKDDFDQYDIEVLRRAGVTDQITKYTPTEELAGTQTTQQQTQQTADQLDYLIPPGFPGPGVAEEDI